MKFVYSVYYMLILFVIYIFNCVHMYVFTENKNCPFVKIPQGQLRGQIDVDRNGCIFYSFKGIPYAKPPIGSLRFRDPKPPDSWTGIRNAFIEGSSCTQYYYGEYIGDEDCLFLNVYTPKLPKTEATNTSAELKAVMVWIHGGSFIENSGDSKLFGPKKLVAEDVVLVTFNYRLNVPGFLSFNDSSLDVPGNAGMKDQTMALRWVRDNIRYFGGDPNKVTLFGESAGGASVHLHVLSPMSKGLFRAASAESGTALGFWAITEPFAYIIANELGFNTTGATDRDVLTFFESVPKYDLIKAQVDYNRRNQQIPGINFIGPIVEHETENDGREHFLTQEPLVILNEGTFTQVPFITGYTDVETMIVLFNVSDWGKLFPKNVNDFQSFLPVDKGLVFNSSKALEAARQLQDFYFSNKTSFSQQLHSFLNITRDIFFLTNAIPSVRFMASKSTQPVYLYRFAMDTKINQWKRLFHFENFTGAAHSDDNGYLFSYDGEIEVLPGEIEDINIKRMTRLWSNFAKYGNPNGEYDTVDMDHCSTIRSSNSGEQQTEHVDEILGNIKWKAVCKNLRHLDYLQLNSFDLVPAVNPDNENVVFWDNMFEFLSDG